jgi:hypothetical protein
MFLKRFVTGKKNLKVHINCFINRFYAQQFPIKSAISKYLYVLKTSVKPRMHRHWYIKMSIFHNKIAYSKVTVKRKGITNCPFCYSYMGAWGSVVVRHCATSWMVQGSIPSVVTGDFFHGSPWQNHAPWGQLSLWKWVPGISPGVKAAGAYSWWPTTLVVPNVKKIRGHNPPRTPSATSACCGMTFTLPDRYSYITMECHQSRPSSSSATGAPFQTTALIFL